MHINRVISLRESVLLFLFYVSHFCSQIAWVDLALVTATRIIHHSIYALRDWAFVERRHGGPINFDEKIFAEFLWCQTQRHPQDNERKATLVVAIQPYWVLDENDMNLFVGCTAVRFASYSHPKARES